VKNIVGTGTYAVPSSDAALAAATSGLSTLIGGVAGLTVGNVSAWVTTGTGSTPRELNALCSNVQYNGELCPDATETAAMLAAIEAALIADPNITSVTLQSVNIENVPTGPPIAHASSHENGGADEISVAGLSGALADAQTPTSHASSHENGGADEISVAGLSGALADAQTPTSHAIGGAEHSSSTLAQLNGKVSNATLIDQSYVYSNLWFPPASPGIEDDEFTAGSFNPAYVVHNLGPNAAGAVVGTPNVYDNTFLGGLNIRAVSSPSTRRSWAFFQPPGTNVEIAFCKPFLAAPGSAAPYVFMGRCLFHQDLALGVGDYSIGIGLFQQNLGVPDVNNYMLLYLNSSGSGTIRAEHKGVFAGAPFAGSTTSNVGGDGQALEYVAIQRLGSNLHAFAGTGAGNWIYMGAASVAGFSPIFLGVVMRNNGAGNPGVGVMAVDFIRFYPGESNFLF